LNAMVLPTIRFRGGPHYRQGSSSSAVCRRELPSHLRLYPSAVTPVCVGGWERKGRPLPCLAEDRVLETQGF